MIDTVIRNLISNAIKFTPKGGNIIVETTYRPQDGFLTLYVKDDGVGISSEQLKHLFRIDNNYSIPGTEGETGTGLGLILCKEFVEKNGGKIDVSSKQQKGSVFSFSVPVSEKKRFNASD
jgi:signal transduction histidine kinase